MLQHTLLSPFLYVVLHVLFAIFLIPCSPMTVIAGVIWGTWLGLSISCLSAVLSSSATFLLSRYFLRHRIYNYLSKRYAKTDWVLAQTKKHGWKFVASAQLNPAVPGSTLGYLFGLTNIEASTYILYVVIFMLPLQFFLVFAGHSVTKFNSNFLWVFMEIGLAFLAIYIAFKLYKMAVLWRQMHDK